MNKLFSYPWTLLFGFYYYLLFQLIYLARFGSFNINFGYLDAFLPILGILSLTIFVFFARKLESKTSLLWIPFAIALPLSLIGALGGGLLGFLGILIFGLLPFLVVLPIGFWIIRRFAKREQSAVEM